jgi:hypothetical protein
MTTEKELQQQLDVTNEEIQQIANVIVRDFPGIVSEVIGVRSGLTAGGNCSALQAIIPVMIAAKEKIDTQSATIAQLQHEKKALERSDLDVQQTEINLRQAKLDNQYYRNTINDATEQMSPLIARDKCNMRGNNEFLEAITLLVKMVTGLVGKDLKLINYPELLDMINPMSPVGAIIKENADYRFANERLYACLIHAGIEVHSVNPQGYMATQTAIKAIQTLHRANCNLQSRLNEIQNDNEEKTREDDTFPSLGSGLRESLLTPDMLRAAANAIESLSGDLPLADMDLLRDIADDIDARLKRT